MFCRKALGDGLLQKVVPDRNLFLNMHLCSFLIRVVHNERQGGQNPRLNYSVASAELFL